LFKECVVVVLDAEVGELLLEDGQGLLVPLHGEVVVLGFAEEHHHDGAHEQHNRD